MKRFLKHLLTKKTGVTVLEGLIALGLLALVAGGTFGVLLSVSRKTGTPDIREEMALAVERANELLPMYAPLLQDSNMSDAGIADEYKEGLCGKDDPPRSPLSPGEHHIECLLPPICDEQNSSFVYTVAENPITLPSAVPSNTKDYYYTSQPHRQITFKITCNGFSL